MLTESELNVLTQICKYLIKNITRDVGPFENHLWGAWASHQLMVVSSNWRPPFFLRVFSAPWNGIRPAESKQSEHGIEDHYSGCRKKP